MKTPIIDLAIIGAGLSGLAAARRAQELGISVEVFEASDEVGGRVRSDRVNGFICDRGFQLINPAYPALARYYKPSAFHQLDQAIDVVIGNRTHRLGDPRAGFSSIRGGLSSETGSIAEKLRFLRYLRSLDQSQAEKIENDRSFEEEMLRAGVGTFYSRVIGPFATGVFLNLPSRISARIARELIHFFLTGKPGLPYGGVGEVSRAISAGLTVHLNSAVEEIGEDFVRIGRRRIKARAVIVATDPLVARTLIDHEQVGSKKLRSLSVLPREMSGSTTWYHSVAGVDFPGALRIDGGGGGPITNTIAISRLAPEYAPANKTLISTTVMSGYGQNVSESRVRKHLSKLWQMETESWQLVAKYSIPRSLPLMPPGNEKHSFVDLSSKSGKGKRNMLRYLVGDYLALPAQQGAMESGIKAAEDVAARL